MPCRRRPSPTARIAERFWHPAREAGPHFLALAPRSWLATPAQLPVDPPANRSVTSGAWRGSAMRAAAPRLGAPRGNAVVGNAHFVRGRHCKVRRGHDTIVRHRSPRLLWLVASESVTRPVADVSASRPALTCADG